MSDPPDPPPEVSADAGRSEDQGTGRFARLQAVTSPDEFVTRDVDPQRHSAREERPGASEGPPNWWVVALGILALVLLSGMIVWAFGQWQQGRIQQYLTSQAPLPAPWTALIDVQQGKALLLERMGEYRRILVQEQGKSNLLMVAGPTVDIRNTALSADGEWVAYTTLADDGAVVWTSLVTNTQESFTSADIAAISSELALCPWTPISWSPASDRLAFFACDQNARTSVLLWLPIANPVPNVIASSAVQSTLPRDLRWLAQEILIATNVKTDVVSANQVVTYPTK
jgi:hypothetical protein